MLSGSPKRNSGTKRYLAARAIGLMLCTWASAQMLEGISSIARELERSTWVYVAVASPLTPALSQRQRESFTPSAPGSLRSVPAVHSRSEFDSLAVVYDPNTPYALPHVLFVIDRQKGNRI